MSDLNLLYTDVEDDLRSSVRDLVAARSEPRTVAGVYDGFQVHAWTILRKGSPASCAARRIRPRFRK